MAKKNIVILASGTGSNAQKIINHFRSSSFAHIALIVSNKPDAGVLQIARQENIPTDLIDRQSFYHTDDFLLRLKALPADLIVLAGFLWKVPDNLLQAFPNQIINIHPALLPLYGGKGMYGMKVHQAVLAARDKESGITIHYTNEVYDEGEVILQKK